MTKATQKLAPASNFVGKSAKEVRELALAGRVDRAEALAYAQAKVAELSGHKFRGQLWAATVTALSAKPKAGKTVANPLAGISPEQLAAIVAMLKA